MKNRIKDKYPILRIRKKIPNPGYIIGSNKYSKEDRRKNKEEIDRELGELYET